MTPKTYIRSLILFLLVLAPVTSGSAVSIDQGFIEKSLADNKKFMQNLNISVSNFGAKPDINNLISASRHDFLARIWYLQGRYVKAYKEIRKSQEIMSYMFRDILRLYIDHTREILESYAPMVIRSRDKYASHYLQLGFRDLKNTEDYLETGHNYSRLLFSNKIHLYMEGIKRSRRGKRYAILSMIEAVTPRRDKPQFKLQTLDDIREKKNPVDDIGSYRRIGDTLKNYYARRLLEPFIPPSPSKPRMQVLEHHDDNYGVISKDKCSVLDEYNPEFKGTSNLDVAKVIIERDIVKEELVKMAEEKEKASSDLTLENAPDGMRILGCRVNKLPEEVQNQNKAEEASAPGGQGAPAGSAAAAPAGNTAAAPAGNTNP